MHDHIKTKATCIANQDKRKKSNKPIRSRSIQLQVGPSAGNCEQENWRYGREAFRSTAWPSATKPEIVQNSTNKRKKKQNEEEQPKDGGLKLSLFVLNMYPTSGVFLRAVSLTKQTRDNIVYKGFQLNVITPNLDGPIIKTAGSRR